MPSDYKSNNIFEAAQNNDEKAVKRFVEEERVPVTTTNVLGMTAAHIAASNGKLSILKYLVEKNASLVDMKDRWQQTVLHMAVGKGALDVVEYLVDNCNADIFQSSYVFHFNSVLHIAAETGRLNVLQFFVEKKKLDANKRNSEGQPPAFLAAGHDHVHVVEYLVDEANADLTMVDNGKRNILHMSTVHGFLRVPKFLLDQRNISLDINDVDHLGRSVLNAASLREHVNFIKYFVEEKHADVNLADNVGWTPLHQVSYLGNVKLVRYFLDHGADPKIEDSHGKTPLDSTTNEEAAKCLKEAIQNRTRRSISEAGFAPYATRERVLYSVMRESIDDGPPSLARLDSNSCTNSGAGSYDVDRLLILANTFLRWFGRSSESLLVREDYVPTSRRALRDRIDSVVASVVDSIANKTFGI